MKDNSTPVGKQQLKTIEGQDLTRLGAIFFTFNSNPLKRLKTDEEVRIGIDQTLSTPLPYGLLIV